MPDLDPRVKAECIPDAGAPLQTPAYLDALPPLPPLALPPPAHLKAEADAGPELPPTKRRKFGVKMEVKKELIWKGCDDGVAKGQAHSCRRSTGKQSKDHSCSTDGKKSRCQIDSDS